MPLPDGVKEVRLYSAVRVATVLRWAASDHPRAPAAALGVVKVARWFEGLRAHLGSLNAYSVGKQLQPGVYTKLSHSNLWSKYAAGKHVPRKVLGKVEEKLCGSRQVVDWPGWRALDVMQPIGTQAVALIRTLNPRIQTACFDKAELKLDRYELRTNADKLLKKLEQRACWDAVAAATIVLRLAHEQGDQQGAHRAGRSLYYLLLMMAVTSSAYWIAPEIFAYFIHFIFPLAATSVVAYDLHHDAMWQRTQWLYEMVLEHEDEGRPLASFGADTRRLRRVFVSPKYGFDRMLGFAPRLKHVASEVDESKRRTLAYLQVFWQWGERVLAHGRRQPMPPEHLVEQLEAAWPTTDTTDQA